MQNNINRIQSELFTKQDQISSGKKSTTYAGLGSMARSSIEFNNQKSTVESYQYNITTATLYLNYIEPSIERMGEVANEVGDEILKNKDGSAPDTAYLKSMANDRLEEMNRLLNIQYNGKYLFSGSATTTKPMDGSTVAQGNVNTIIDGYTSADAMTRYDAVDTYLAGNVGDYYKGDQAGPVHSARIDDGMDLDYGVRGDEAAIQKIYKGLYVVSTMEYNPDESDAYWEIMDRALGDLQSGFDELQTLHASIGDKQKQVENSKLRHQDTLLVIEQQIGEIEDVDSAKVIMEFNALETQLNASYSMISTLSGMTLANYI